MPDTMHRRLLDDPAMRRAETIDQAVTAALARTAFFAAMGDVGPSRVRLAQHLDIELSRLEVEDGPFETAVRALLESYRLALATGERP